MISNILEMMSAVEIWARFANHFLVYVNSIMRTMPVYMNTRIDTCSTARTH